METAYNLFLKLVDIFNKKSVAAAARLNLARWYNEVEDFGNNEFNKVLDTFENQAGWTFGVMDCVAKVLSGHLG